MKGHTLLAAVAAFALLVAGCASTPAGDNTTANTSGEGRGPGQETLLGTWQLTLYLGANGGTVQAVAGSVPLVTFGSDGSISGTLGCNRFAGNYTARDGQLSIGSIASTLMYCPDPAGVMDQEQRVFELFPLTAGYTVAGSTLALLDGTGSRIMTFERAAESPSLPLAETTWRLSGFLEDGTARSALAGSNATLVFSTDGKVSGTTGCNNLMGPYTTSGSTISIGPLATTRKACADTALATQEQDLLAVLEAAAAYEIQGDRLVLADTSGYPSVDFVGIA